MHSTILKGNMGDDQYTVPDDCSYRTYFCCFPLALANTFPWPFMPILSNFSEKKRTQNHPQCLSGLLRALFPTTFLKIAVYLPTFALQASESQVFRWKNSVSQWLNLVDQYFSCLGGKGAITEIFLKNYIFIKINSEQCEKGEVNMKDLFASKL